MNQCCEKWIEAEFAIPFYGFHSVISDCVKDMETVFYCPRCGTKINTSEDLDGKEKGRGLGKGEIIERILGATNRYDYQEQKFDGPTIVRDKG